MEDLSEITFNEDGYNEQMLEQVKDLALLGLTDEQIAGVWGMPYRQFQRLKQDKLFMATLQEGKTIADAKVAACLYRRATGYNIIEEHVCNTKDGPVVVKVNKHIPPDPWSTVKWLAIRQRAMWSETQRMEITNTQININKLDFSGLSTDELLAIKNIQQKQLSQDATGS